MSSGGSGGENQNLLKRGKSTESVSLRPTPLTWGCYCRVRRLRSKGAVLVLLWSIAASASGLTPPFESAYAGEILWVITAVVYCPLAGLLGDVYIEKRKFLHANALMAWFGNIAVLLATILEYRFPGSSSVLNYCVILPACILNAAGVSGIQVFSLTFGIDQMPAASTEEISAFVHWLVWSWFAGEFINSLEYSWYACTEYYAASMIVALLTAIASSFILCTNYLCKNWLIFEPKCQSPVKNIVSVLRYAFTHKHPAQRSAFTYWEDEIPSRVDLGKSKYGGPFTNEQVEDVKVFFRIIVATVSIFAFIIPTIATLASVSVFHYEHPVHPTCYVYDFFLLHVLLLTVLSIPVYEFVLYPILRRWIPSSLKRTAVFGSLTVAVSIYLVMVEVVGQSDSESDNIPCMFEADENSSTLPINYFAVDVPVGVLTALQWLAFDIAAFEFVCAQTPYNMKGLLTGLNLAMFYLAFGLGETAFYGWSHSMNGDALGLSCGMWYYLFTMAIGIVGLVLLVIVGRWYKERKRDDVISEHRFAEAYYSALQ